MMRIASLSTKSGQTIHLGKFSVLVGANNVGKSQTLRDVLARVRQGSKGRMVILTDVSLQLPDSTDALLAGLNVSDDPERIDHKICRGVSSNLVSGEEVRFADDALDQQFKNRSQENSEQWILSQFGKFRIGFLDAGSRLQIAASAQAHDPSRQAPQRLLQGLLYDGDARAKFQEAFHDTFEVDVRLDYSALANLYLRVGDKFPTPLPENPAELFPIMQSFQSLDEQGDGFRSFAGVLLSLLLSKGRILLIDEPEAFLHPIQARRLGHWVGRYASGTGAQIIVSTHNSHFLSGVISSKTEVDVYRLNRVGDETSYQLIDTTTINKLSNSPLLSSQRVTDAVFQRGVVVCEADSDRLFYQAVATRAHDEHEIQFLNAHNKQTLKEVVSLLRAASIPCGAIADIDLLNSAKDVTDLLASFGVAPPPDDISVARDKIATAVEGESEEAILKSLTQAVDEFNSQLREGTHDLSGARSALRRLDSAGTRWAIIKEKGVKGLSDSLQTEANALLKSLAAKGVFVVPVGELESWIDVGTRRKRRWIVLALEHIAQHGVPRPLGDFVKSALEGVRA